MARLVRLHADVARDAVCSVVLSTPEGAAGTALFALLAARLPFVVPPPLLASWSGARTMIHEGSASLIVHEGTATFVVVDPLLAACLPWCLSF